MFWQKSWVIIDWLLVQKTWWATRHLEETRSSRTSATTASWTASSWEEVWASWSTGTWALKTSWTNPPVSAVTHLDRTSISHYIIYYWSYTSANNGVHVLLLNIAYWWEYVEFKDGCGCKKHHPYPPFNYNLHNMSTITHYWLNFHSWETIKCS